MNFEQAKELSFTVLWQAVECFSGPECWCRMIVPVEPIFYIHPESPDTKHEYTILDAGSLDQTTAEYIVGLHNRSIEIYKSQKKRLKALKELSKLDEELGL